MQRLIQPLFLKYHVRAVQSNFQGTAFINWFDEF